MYLGPRPSQGRLLALSTGPSKGPVPPAMGSARRGRATPHALAAVALAICAACSGRIGASAPGGSDPAGAPSTPTPPGQQPGASGGNMPGGAGPGGAGPSVPVVPGAAPLRRLTVREYSNTVRDLLGAQARPPRDFSLDQDAAGFAIGGPVSTATDASRLLESADVLAAAADIPTLVPCPNPTPASEETCARDFIQRFGKRAFRRPLAADEVGDLLAVYTAHRGPEIGANFPDAVRAVVAALLSSPFFLYRAELGMARPVRDGAVLRFNPFEMASRLSYGLWSTMPDDTLFAEAEAGRLQTPEQIDQQARRMVKDARFRDALDDFHLQWLEIAGLPTEPPKDARFKDYTPELVTAMMAETRGFVAQLYAGAQASGSLDRFFTASPTPADPGLAKLYGESAARERAGVLTHASFLAMHADAGESHPVRRGAVLMRRVFCIDVPPPPNMDVGETKPPAPGLTTRDRYAQHAEQPCASCHKLTDPIGFAFEHYDAIGAFRAMDQGKPVDASGGIDLPSGRLQWADAVELGRKLPATPEVQQCLATQWLRYLLRRNEFDGDQPSLQAATAALGGSSLDFREALYALVKSRAFTHRAPSPGEVLP
jgi:hypothetical protein